MTTLRPIGTVFTHRFAPSMESNNPCPTEATYEVIAHTPTIHGVREEVKVLKTRELPPPKFIRIRGGQKTSKLLRDVFA